MVSGHSGFEGLLEAAVQSVGQAYEGAEARLLAAGSEVTPFLEQRMAASGPFEGLVAQVVLDRIHGETLQKILDYLDAAEREAAASIARVPSPTAVRNYLTAEFGDGAARILGVHLAKLHTLWPGWKRFAALLYLHDVRSAEALPGLVRFLASMGDEELRDEELRDLAVAAVRSTAVAAGTDRLLAALQEMESAGGELLAGAQQVRETLAPLV